MRTDKSIDPKSFTTLLLKSEEERKKSAAELIIAQDEIAANEIKYRNLIDNAGVVMYASSLEGIISFCNNKVLQLTGYQPSELKGKHFGHLVAPEWKKIVYDHYTNQILNKVEESHLDFCVQTRTGEIKWVEQSSILLLNNEGKPEGFHCIVKDISERKDMEALVDMYETQLIQNQERLQSILDNATSLIYIKDLKGNYLVVNKKFKQALCVTEERVIGKTDFDFTDFEKAERYREADELVISTKKPVVREEIITTASGEIHVLLEKFPLLDEGNKVYGISGIATNITERVKYQAELIKAKQIAESAEKMQEHFLANMSHEIRTPMNGIMGMTDLLLETNLDAEQVEYAQIIKQSSDNLVIIINDILDFSKIKAGKLTIEKVDFSLREILSNIERNFRRRIDEKKLAFHIRVGDGIPATLCGDPYRLNQVLVNLVGNAIKFTHAGLIELNVVLAYSDINGVKLNFTINDSGIGIREEALADIFQSFTQANSGITREYGGTGLGLAICRQLLHLQGGEIQVSSVVGEGSSFSFHIFYDYSNSTKKIEKITSPPSKKGIVVGKKFLIAEDNVVNQKVVMQVIKKAGGLAEVVSNGEEAIALLKTGKQFDIIIMDLQMPIMDGYKATTYIREEMGLKIPIIAMTASALKGEKIKCLQLGMNDYLSKPFAFTDFYQSVNDVLEGARYSSEKVLVGSFEISPSVLYDLALLAEMKDDDYTIEVLEIYLKETPLDIRKLCDAAIHKNNEEVYAIAHKLKSSAGLLRISQMLALLEAIEVNSKTGNENEQLLVMVNEVSILYNKVANLLQQQMQLLNNKKAVNI